MTLLDNWVADPTLEVFKVTRFPDLSLPKYLAKYQGNTRKAIVDAQHGFLSLLWELRQLDSSNSLTFTLRYHYRRPLIHCYLLAKSDQVSSNLPPISEIIMNSPVADFYTFSAGPEDPAQRSEWKRSVLQGLDENQWASEVVIVAKEENLLSPLHPGKAGHPQAYYVTYPLEPSPENDYAFLDQMLYHMNCGQVIIDVMVRPTTLTRNEEKAMKEWIIALDKVNSSRDVGDELRERRADREEDLSAKSVMDIFETYYSEYVSSALFEVCLRFATERPRYAQVIASSVMTGVTKGTRFAVNAQIDASPDRREPELYGAYPGGFPADPRMLKVQRHWTKVEKAVDMGDAHAAVFKDMGRLSYVCQLDEVAPFFRMIIPGPNIPQTYDRESDVSLDKDERSDRRIRLGIDFERRRRVVYIDRERLKKHLFIAGVPGSGKTTMVLNVLIRLWSQKIPFLVIEPAKTEYRTMTLFSTAMGDDSAMYRRIAEDLHVFTIGRDQGCPFRFNPFEFAPGISLDQHLANLDACFRGALPLDNPMPALLSEAIDYVYRVKGWHGEDSGDTDRALPAMEDLYKAIGYLINKKKYSEEIRDNISTALEVRIGGLLKRNIGQIFNTQRSVPHFADLMSVPVILEMDALSEEQKNLMTMFVLMALREYVQGNYRTGDPLHHILVLEEAHNVVGSMTDGDDEANPKLHATRFVSRMLAEVRALGQGLIIADQIPTAVAPEVIKNTGIKAINRIVSMDDRETIGMAMLLDPIQNEDLARLNPGEGYLYMEGMPKPLKFVGDDPRKLKFSDEAGARDITTLPPPSERELMKILRLRQWSQNHLAALAQHALDRLQDFRGEMQTRYADLERRLEQNTRLFEEGERGCVEAVRTGDPAVFERSLGTLSDQLKALYEIADEVRSLQEWLTLKRDEFTRYLNLLVRIGGLVDGDGGPGAEALAQDVGVFQSTIGMDAKRIAHLQDVCRERIAIVEKSKNQQQEIQKGLLRRARNAARPAPVAPKPAVRPPETKPTAPPPQAKARLASVPGSAEIKATINRQRESMYDTYEKLLASARSNHAQYLQLLGALGQSPDDLPPAMEKAVQETSRVLRDQLEEAAGFVSMLETSVVGMLERGGRHLRRVSDDPARTAEGLQMLRADVDDVIRRVEEICVNLRDDLKRLSSYGKK